MSRPFDVGDVDVDGADVVTATRVLLGSGATVAYRDGRGPRRTRRPAGQILVAGGGTVAIHRLDGSSPVPGQPTPTPTPTPAPGIDRPSPLETDPRR